LMLFFCTKLAGSFFGFLIPLGSRELRPLNKAKFQQQKAKSVFEK
jgi:hypothetical protein